MLGRKERTNSNTRSLAEIPQEGKTMSQQDAMKVLEKNKGWMTSKEIARKTGVGHNTTSANLSKLFKGREIHKRRKFRREMEYRARLTK